MCHQQDGSLCAGWCGTHDMAESLGLRITAAAGLIEEEDLSVILDYQTPVPLFDSGAEAAEHGLAELEKPSEQASRVIDRLIRKRREDLF